MVRSMYSLIVRTVPTTHTHLRELRAIPPTANVQGQGVSIADEDVIFDMERLIQRCEEPNRLAIFRAGFIKRGAGRVGGVRITAPRLHPGAKGSVGE